MGWLGKEEGRGGGAGEGASRAGPKRTKGISWAHVKAWPGLVRMSVVVGYRKETKSGVNPEESLP